MIGKTLGHYKITGLVGKGGMGEVYRASDDKLGRDVAIKILPPELANDPERVARFDREARTLASLQHPNVATIYGFEESDGVRFLAMELVEGEDLSEVLSRGRISVDEALRIGRQMATGIEAAHDKNVVHRDLKPANVKVAPGGAVKILDFGLARAYTEDPSGVEDLENSPTITARMTQPGVVLGTAAYMSPEQARGKAVDKRTDIWAFGCLLYEMLTGVSAFRGETITDTLASIVKTPADFGKLPADTPQRVRDLLQRCLEKDPRNRLRDIGEARIELQRAIDASDAVSVTSVTDGTAPRRRLPSPLWVVTAIVIGAVGGIATWSALRPGSSATSAGDGQVVRFSIEFPEDVNINDWVLSPNGQTILFRGRPNERTAGGERAGNRIYLRSLDAFEMVPVENSEGVANYSFSPDGRWLVIRKPVAPRSTRYRLWKVPVEGDSPPLALTDWRDEWSGTMLWLPDGDIVVGTTGRKSIVRIPSGGGEPSDPLGLQYVGFEGEGGFDVPYDPRTVLPDGGHVFGNLAIYSERGWEGNVGLLDLATGEVRLLIENGSNPVLSSTGHLVFSRADAILATAFDTERLELVGNTVAIQSGFRALAGWGDTNFGLASNGTKVQWPGGVYGDRRKIAFADLTDAKEFGITGSWSDDLRAFERMLEVSRDGRRLAVCIANNAGLYETWISDMDRPRLTRFAYEPGRDVMPLLWTPDGETLIYRSETTKEAVLAVRNVDDTGDARTLISFPQDVNFVCNDFLDNGATLVATRLKDRQDELVLIPMDTVDGGPETPTVWLKDANDAHVSADGRWVAYNSDASGREELYIRPLREDGSLGREIPLSTSGAGTPFWNDVASPPLLMYHRADEVYSIAVNGDGRFGEPQLVGSIDELGKQTRGHAHMPDGRWLVVVRDENEETPDRVNVVLNWTEELKRRMASQ